MKCPRCKSESSVIDSRESRETVRRRRQCLNKNCQHRWTTWEVEDRTMRATKRARDAFIAEWEKV